MLFSFYVNKKKINKLKYDYLNNIKNIDLYNAFYTIYTTKTGNEKERIDINLCSSLYSTYSDIYYSNDKDTKTLIIYVLINVISETLEHEYTHKAIGKYINKNYSRTVMDKIIEKITA